MSTPVCEKIMKWMDVPVRGADPILEAKLQASNIETGLNQQRVAAWLPVTTPVLEYIEA